MNDLKFAIRQLLKNPGFTTVAVLTLALGIGANTAIFQLLNAVRLKTLPVSKPQELVEVRIIGGNPGLGISDGDNAEITYPLWEKIRKEHEPISRLLPGAPLSFPGGTTSKHVWSDASGRAATSSRRWVSLPFAAGYLTSMTTGAAPDLPPW